MKHGELKIDLGCGLNKAEGYLGVDIKEAKGVDIVRDIEKHGLPFCDNSAIEIRAVSTLEHFTDLIFVMNECWRVLKPEGVLWGTVPRAGSDAANRDPTHKRYFVVNSFKYFKKDYTPKFLYGIKPWHPVEVELVDKGVGHIPSVIKFRMYPYKKWSKEK